MGNKIFQAILNEKIEKFRFAFEKTSRDIFWDENTKSLLHPGEYGTYREAVCKEYLRLIIPMGLDINSGFLINTSDQVGTQCDIIVFDKNSTPLIESDEKQRFYPVETAVAIGEIKSDLDKSSLKIALNKLARNKKLRESITNPFALRKRTTDQFNPANNFNDNLFSFLICNKLNFDHSNLIYEIDGLYDKDIAPWQKHNLILSVKDGLLTYYEETKNKTMLYPFIWGRPLKNRLVAPHENINVHFQYFSTYIFMATSTINIYYPEMSDYITDLYGGLNFTQE